MISDVDLEWILLQERLREPDRAQRRVASRPWRMPRRLAPAPVGAGTAAVAAVLVIGAGAAAALTTIYAPAGVGSPSSIAIQPQVTATVHFSQSAGPAIGGSTLEITGGPAIVVQYGSRSARASLTTLAIAAMQRPVAASTGATASQLETFLLSRPGVPAGLAQELRLLGNPGTTLPVPVPSGVSEQQLTIGQRRGHGPGRASGDRETRRRCSSTPISWPRPNTSATG